MDRQKINTLASKTGSNRYVKHLDGYSHLVVMLYAVLCNLRSLREVCLGFEANATRMNHFGLDHMICRSTLSDANKRRSSSFFGSIYRMLLRGATDKPYGGCVGCANKSFHRLYHH